MINSRHVPLLNPASSKWYFISWQESELGVGVTITASEWGKLTAGVFSGTVPTGLTEAEAYSSGLVTGIRIAGGTIGTEYQVVNQITTSSGETLHEIIPITVGIGGH